VRAFAAAYPEEQDGEGNDQRNGKRRHFE
jgi:hypothetical protein